MQHSARPYSRNLMGVEAMSDQTTISALAEQKARVAHHGGGE